MSISNGGSKNPMWSSNLPFKRKAKSDMDLAPTRKLASIAKCKTGFMEFKKINLLVFFFLDHESGFDTIIGEENAVGVNCHMAHISLKKHLTRCLFFFQPSKPKFLRY